MSPAISLVFSRSFTVLPVVARIFPVNAAKSTLNTRTYRVRPSWSVLSIFVNVSPGAT
ncbi:hypothetical protein ABZ905_27560 [Streptomyces parvus]|uniref:hypothetical protein n=1 Tax=Streptomyces parvus TaxID=66428 RepID=UPI0033DCF0F6